MVTKFLNSTLSRYSLQHYRTFRVCVIEKKINQINEYFDYFNIPENRTPNIPLSAYVFN